MYVSIIEKVFLASSTASRSEGFTTLQKSPTLDSSLLLFYSPSLLLLHIQLYTLVRSCHTQMHLLLLQF